MNPRLFRLTVTLGIAAGVIGLAMLIASPIALGRPFAFSLPSASIAATDGNLLINPDFENGYNYPLPCCNNIAVPVGWNIRCCR